MIKILFTKANAKEVMYFKEIIKGVKSKNLFSCRGFLARRCEHS